VVLMNEDLFEPLTDVDDTNPLNTDTENWIEFEHVCSFSSLCVAASRDLSVLLVKQCFITT